MFTLFMTDRPVTNFVDAKTADLALFGRYFQAMLKRGIYLPPSQFESLFISTALTDELIEQVIQANEESLSEVLEGRVLVSSNHAFFHYHSRL